MISVTRKFDKKAILLNPCYILSIEPDAGGLGSIITYGLWSYEETNKAGNIRRSHFTTLNVIEDMGYFNVFLRESEG